MANLISKPDSNKAAANPKFKTSLSLNNLKQATSSIRSEVAFTAVPNERPMTRGYHHKVIEQNNVVTKIEPNGILSEVKTRQYFKNSKNSTSDVHHCNINT
jgi:hypothetical protein